MGETQNLRAVRHDKYDPLKARYIRDIKTTDIVNLYSKEVAATSDTISFDLVLPYVVGANTDLYPYIFGAHHCGTDSCPQFALVVDTTTVMAIQTDVNGAGQNLVTGCDCPLTRVAESSTIEVIVPYAVAGDTYCAFLVCKREPLLNVVEDD
ncbi:unnamed protein product [marine sediment metagenome]|uniref:Uncharacterized protein n=1 Tax=marine sediment metagenome TaxID=412755 RepID=X1JV93_9ZZZZ